MAITAPPSIATLPTPPDPNDRASFNTRAYPWAAAQAVFGTEVSAVASNVYSNASQAETLVNGAMSAGLEDAAENAAIAIAKAAEAAASAEEAATILSSKEPVITDGTASQFWRGDKTWVDFATTVRATALTGLSLATNAAITATDTVLSALGKLQKQITDLASANKGDETAASIRTKLGITTLSGSNTGDETIATIKSKLGVTTLSGSNTGDQTLASLGAAPVASPSFTGNTLVVDPAGGLGYGAGAGGVVVQTTSKSTAVTLNNPVGQIVTNNAALAAGASVTFTLTDFRITSHDVLGIQVEGYNTNHASYSVKAATVGSGAYVTLTNTSAGSLSEAVILTFNLHKGSVI